MSKLKSWINQRTKWIKWAVIIILPLLVAVALASAKGGGGGMPVVTALVEKKPIEQSVIANGRLESADKQEFFTPVDSTLMELSVKVGDKVTQGQVLGRLDTLELGRRYEEAKARLALRQADLATALGADDNLSLASARAQYDRDKNNYERINYLFEEGAVTVQELEVARAGYAQAQAIYREASVRAEQQASAKRVASLQAQVDLAVQEVAQAKERLDMATFVASSDGVVLFVAAEQGSRVMEGSRLLVVGSDTQLEVTAEINEIDAGFIKVGQSVKLTCTALPGREFEGEVTRVASVAVIGSGGTSINVPVTVKIFGDTSGLKPGYTVDLNIITMEEKEFLAVPYEALATRGIERVVYVVEDGVAKERQVKTEKGNELYDIVISGLKEGEQVITNPPPVIKDGVRVLVGENR